MPFFKRSKTDIAPIRHPATEPTPEPLRKSVHISTTPPTRTRNASTFPQVSSTPRSRASTKPERVREAPFSSTSTARLLQDLLDKYDSKPLKLPHILPMNDNWPTISDPTPVATNRYHKHDWVLMSCGEKGYCTIDRFAQIHHRSHESPKHCGLNT